MKKNILFIIPQLVGGGAEKTVANLSLYLKEKYNINILIFNDSDEKYKYSGNLIVLPKKKSNNFFGKVINEISIISKVRKIKNKLNIDYSISFLRDADLVNVFSRVNDRIYLSIRNKESVDSKILRNKLKIYISCKKADKVIAISKEVERDIVSKFHINSEKVITIYNPCLISEYENKNNIDAVDKLFKNKITIINVARLNYQKGQWHLIRAFNEVIKKIPTAQLLILGKGEEESYLKELINKLNLQDNVKLLGFVNNPYDYMRKSDLFVFSSLYEGLGNSLMEALACELPILSTDYECGAREILSPNKKIKVCDKINYCEYGILVPVCDGKKYSYSDPLSKEEKIMADAIVQVLSDKNKLLKYRKQSIKRSKDFSIDNIVNQWSNILK